MLNYLKIIKNKINKFYHVNNRKLDLNYFIKNGFWVTLYYFCSFAFSILLMIFFTRFTTKEVFGEYNFLLSIVGLLFIFSIPGLNTSVLRSVARGKDGAFVKSVKLSFKWSLLAVPLILIIGSYYFFFEEKIIGIGLFILAPVFPFFYAPNTWIALLKGKSKFDLFAKYSIIQSLIMTSSIILIIFVGKGSLIPIFVTYLIIQIIFNFVYYFKSMKFINNDNEEEGWKKSGYKLSILEFISTSYNYLDKIIIGILLGPISLAIYVVATFLITPLQVLISENLKILYPKLFNMEKELLIPTMRKFIFKTLLSVILLTLILIYLAPTLITTLFSQNYADSIIYSQFYLLTVPLALIMNITNTILIALKLENSIIRFRLIGLMIIVALYSILIPYLGIWGAVLSSILYYLILSTLQYLYLIKKSN